MKNICYDCKKRHVGCHGHCEDYKKWKEEYDKQAKEIRKRKAEYTDYFYHNGKGKAW